MANMSFGSGGSSYYDLARQQQIFIATANVTGMGAYTTAAGTGGPLLWNDSVVAASGARVMAILLAVGIGITTASAAAAGVGITGNSGQITVPGSTTAIDNVANAWIGGPLPVCNPYRIGTPTNAGNFFMPVASLGTGALTVDNIDFSWFDLGGSIIVPPGSWAAVAASAVATTSAMSIGLMWCEVSY
jgi:hypothetical protein